MPQQVAQQQKRVRQLHVQQEPSKTEDPTASAGPLVVGGRASPGRSARANLDIQFTLSG